MALLSLFGEISMNDYDFQLYRLSKTFYEDFPKSVFPEILRKQERPYNCFVVEIFQNVFICIPYRSKISHSNAYLFKRTNRSSHTKSGLDFSKMIIVEDTVYLEDSPKPIVDSDEYRETVTNVDQIIASLMDYIQVFLSHVRGEKVLHSREYQRRYGFSTLPYFVHLLP